MHAVVLRASGSGEPAAPRRQSLLRSQARYALLPAATPRLKGTSPVVYHSEPLESRDTPVVWYVRPRVATRNTCRMNVAALPNRLPPAKPHQAGGRRLPRPGSVERSRYLAGEQLLNMIDKHTGY